MNNEPTWSHAPAPVQYAQAPLEARSGSRAIAEPDTPDDSLSAYTEALARRKGWIALAAIAGALIGSLVSLSQQPIYQARVSLEVQAANVDPLEGGQPKAVRPPSRSAAEFYIATQADLLRSRAVLNRVVAGMEDSKSLTAAVVPSTAGWLPRAFHNWFLSDDAGVAANRRTSEPLSDRYRIEPSRKSGLVEIVSEWPDSETAARFANQLATEFIRLDSEVRRQKAEQTEQWLAHQLGKLRSRLEHSEEELRRYARETGLMFTSSEGSVAEQRLGRLQAELSRAQADRIAKQSQYEMVSGSEPGELTEMLEPARYQIERSALERQLARMSTAYKPAHRKVRETRAELKALEATIAAERDERLDQIRNDFEAARRRERMLEADYGSQARLVSEQAGKSVHYNILQREVDTYRRLYDHLLRKVEEAGLRSAANVGNIRIVDRAVPPVKPIRPDRTMNASLGFVFGLLGGIALVLARHRGDRTLREPGDSSRCLQLPELGVVPASNNIANRYVRVARDKSPRGLGLPGKKSTISIRYGKKRAGTSPVELASWRERDSAVAEAFRTAATSVMLSGDAGRPLRTLVVTSARAGEGKTTVAANLAITLAQIYERVVLIDADLRRPRLHEVFELPNAWGLSDSLKDPAAGHGTSVHELGLLTEVPGLYVLPSGSNTEGVTTLLHSGKTKAFIDRMLKTFDWVVFDTPPAAEFAETRALGRLTDAVVLVAKVGTSSGEDLRSIERRFAQDGARVLGTVLNQWRGPENAIPRGLVPRPKTVPIPRPSARAQAATSRGA